MRAAFAEALLTPDGPAPQGLRVWNGSDPARRFAVYRNNVLVSLIDALATTYPVTRTLVGEDFFRAMARVYATAHPPRSPIMARYGAQLPDFLARFEPARDLAYLPDVASLEAARVAAYHAADATAMSAQDFAALDPQALGDMRFTLHPSLRLVRARHAAFSIWAAHQGQGDLSQIDPFRAEDALILRPALTVETTLTPPGVAAMVAALADGATLGGAVEAAFADHAAFDMPTGLALLIRSGALTGVHDQGDDQ